MEGRPRPPFLTCGGAIELAPSAVTSNTRSSGSVCMSSISPPPRLMPPKGYLAVIRTIDKFTEWTGYLFVLFIIPLILSNAS